MITLRQASLYFNTLRYLKPAQVWGRVVFRLRRLVPDLREAPGLREPVCAWQLPAARNPTMLGPSRFRFLNKDGELGGLDAWNASEFSKLWLYNLHYFDDLNGANAVERRSWHIMLIDRWISENLPGHGIGWEPYPLSLRIVNWIKWALAGNPLDDIVLHSLAIQTRYLSRRLEYHLLGNHLFVNAKALVFAGCFFDGDEAIEWFECGMKILEREIPEQILADGGHFERSPMYHALAYEDMLDLANLALAYPAATRHWQARVSEWPLLIERMGHWLSSMCHPDGEISFFNDAAMGIAPSPGELFNYAQRLGYIIPDLDTNVIWLKDSGYIRVESDNAVLLIDVAPLGPDYLPAHAHADTLSYELSIFGQRVVVNSGTSRYGLDPQRERERATAAHTTLEINGQNSSEVWAGFRVARRAYPFGVTIQSDADCVVVEAAHDGYRRLPGRPIHRRRWIFGESRLDVIDVVEGDFSRAISRVYFHPAINMKKDGRRGIASWAGVSPGKWVIPNLDGCGGGELRWQADGADIVEEPSQWHPEFGITQPSRCLALHVTETAGQSSCTFSLEWC